MGELPQFTEIDRLLFGELKRAGFEPKVVYDIGASNGFWSVLVAQDTFPEASYQLFEPLAETPMYAEHLRKNLAGHPRFALHRVALGAAQGEVDFWTDSEQYGSTAIAMSGVPGFTRRTVPMHRLDDYVHQRELPLPDLMKLDVQGFELEILRHADRCLAQATALYIETWLTRGYGPRTPLMHEMQEHLDSHGFDLLEIGDRYYSDGHSLSSVDALFVKRSWARAAGRQLRPGDWARRR